MRLSNWPSALSVFVESRRRAPFEWGVNDCAIFTADAVMAITGVDYAAEYRGQYHTYEESKELLNRNGYDGMVSVLEKIFNATDPNHIKRGDIAIFTGRYGLTMGICTGNHIVSPGECGIELIPMSAAEKGWAV